MIYVGGKNLVAGAKRLDEDGDKVEAADFAEKGKTDGNGGSVFRKRAADGVASRKQGIGLSGLTVADQNRDFVFYVLLQVRGSIRQSGDVGG